MLICLPVEALARQLGVDSSVLALSSPAHPQCVCRSLQGSGWALWIPSEFSFVFLLLPHPVCSFLQDTHWAPGPKWAPIFQPCQLDSQKSAPHPSFAHVLSATCSLYTAQVAQAQMELGPILCGGAKHRSVGGQGWGADISGGRVRRITQSLVSALKGAMRRLLCCLLSLGKQYCYPQQKNREAKFLARNHTASSWWLLLGELLLPTSPPISGDSSSLGFLLSCHHPAPWGL